jgi:hypothetical protein
MNNFNYSLIDNIVIEDIDYSDFPDFSDAYIYSADYDGRPMTDEELDLLNKDGEFVLDQVFETIL